MKLPLVGREAYDLARHNLSEMRTQYNALLEKYHQQSAMIAELRRDGFQSKPLTERAIRDIPGTPDLDEVARDGAKREFIQRMTADLQKTPGITASMATAEAERLAATMYETYGEGE